MGRKRYRVDYHLVQNIYFEPDAGLSGPEFAQIWSATRAFGEHRATGGFWHAGGPPVGGWGAHEFEIGSLELVEPLLAKGPQPIYGGGKFARDDVARNGTLDADFYFAHGDGSRWEGFETLPDLLWTISGQWLEATGVDAVLTMLKENLAVADRHAPMYGLVDLARSEDCQAGMCYGDIWMMSLPLHRWVEQGNWVRAASKKGDRVRGIYWGNYFGPKLLIRLGGRDEFVARYREQATLKDGAVDAQIWEFTNGVFISLCADPLGCKPIWPACLDFSAKFNLRWLQHELGVRGALCGWEGHEPVIPPAATANEATRSPIGLTRASVAWQSYSPLSKAQLQDVADCVDQARSLVERYLAVVGDGALDPAGLDRLLEAWLLSWLAAIEAGNPAEVEEDVVAKSVGLAFGQYLVDSLGMRWAVITDAFGTEIAVRLGAGENQIQVFTVDAVAKRLELRERGFLQPLFEIVSRQVEIAASSTLGSGY